jgi:hypothetical protein
MLIELETMKIYHSSLLFSNAKMKLLIERDCIPHHLLDTFYKLYNEKTGNVSTQVFDKSLKRLEKNESN